jgi:hypothetical protein
LPFRTEVKTPEKSIQEKKVKVKEEEVSVVAEDDSPIKVNRRSTGSRKRILSSSEEDSDNEQISNGL